MDAGTPEHEAHEIRAEMAPAGTGSRPIVARLGQLMWSLFKSVCALALMLVALELAVRAQDWIRYRTPILSRYLSQQDLVIRDGHGYHGVAGARYKKFVMNNLGLRGPDVPPAPFPTTTRVLVTGASETFGLYESPGMELPRQLEDSLRVGVAESGCPAAAADFEVLNGALFGMTLPTVTLNLQTRMRDLGADFVVYYPTPAQYLAYRLPVAAGPRGGRLEAPRLSWHRALYPRAVAELGDRVNLLLPDRIEDKIRMRYIERERWHKGRNWLFEEPPQPRLEAFRTDLRSLVGVIRSMGATPVLVPHANAFAMDDPPRDQYLLNKWVRFYPRATGETIIAFDSMAREATSTVAVDSATLFFDPVPTLRAAPPPAFADYAHFTDVGAGVLAGGIARVILDFVCRSDESLSD